MSNEFSMRNGCQKRKKEKNDTNFNSTLGCCCRQVGSGFRRRSLCMRFGVSIHSRCKHHFTASQGPNKNMIYIRSEQISMRDIWYRIISSFCCINSHGPTRVSRQRETNIWQNEMVTSILTTTHHHSALPRTSFDV